jgi:tripartite-type tricarboxylate transporter receptor subunit TctC
MRLLRRRFLELVAAALALPTASCLAKAEAYPVRPVHIIVGFQAGTASDIIARLIGEWLSDQLGQQFVIENRPGAAGNVAAEAVAHAAPDGYTLLLVAAVHSISVMLYKNLNFSFARDIAPVASIVRTTLVMEVNPSFPSKTVPDFIAYARDNPGKIAMASPGIGTIQHIAGELFQMMTGTEMVHVPYRGAPPALMDLIGGRVQVMFRCGGFINRVHQIRQVATASGEHKNTFGGTAGRSSHCRFCAWLPGERLDWPWRA